MSSADSIRIENHTITTRDRTALSATLYRPHTHNNQTVLISPAMGIPQRFYRHYAQFLAEHGCVVLTFDFRGIAASRQRETLWGCDADLTQWATQDLQVMLKWLQRQYPGAMLNVVAHSLGGHLLGATPEVAKINAILGVSAQNIYWRNWSVLQQIPLFLFWFILLPLLTYMMGYFPSRRFGMDEPLPAKIALDWSRGAGNRQGSKCLFTGTVHDHYAKFTGSTCFYSFADDTLMAPAKSVDDILTYYPEAAHQERRHISPRQIDVDAIGHNRFFRPEMRDTLWQESLNWLLDPAVEHIARDESPLMADPVAQAG